MIDSPFFRTQSGVFSIQEERIDRSSGECRSRYYNPDPIENAALIRSRAKVKLDYKPQIVYHI
jgi:hypothetical protein